MLPTKYRIGTLVMMIGWGLGNGLLGHLSWSAQGIGEEPPSVFPKNSKSEELPSPLRTLKPQAIGPCPLVYSLDGKLLATGGGDKICLWEESTGQKKSQLKTKQFSGNWIHSITISSDGLVLASGDSETIHLWKVVTRKVIRSMSVGAITVAFSPDGKTLATGGGDSVYLWDAATGKELHRFKRESTGQYGYFNVAFSPDGKTMAAGGGKIGVWEVASGKRLWHFDGAAYFVAFSPNGQTLMGGGDFVPPGQPITTHPEMHPTIHYWDLATGKGQRQVLWQESGWFSYLTLSPDGKTLVTGGPNRQVRFWEVATRTERWSFKGHEAHQFTMAYAPNGKTIAISWGDAAVRIWNTLLPVPDAKEKPSPKELESQWTEIGSEDGAKSFRAICHLIHWNNHSVPFLKERLQSLPPVEPKKIAAFISDLDSDQSKVRQKAMAELEYYGDVVKPALVRALEGKLSLQARRNAEDLLEVLCGPIKNSNRLRALRGVEILEAIGTPEARQVLEALAKGIPEADLTREAKATLERLTQQLPTKP